MTQQKQPRRRRQQDVAVPPDWLVWACSAIVLVAALTVACTAQGNVVSKLSRAKQRSEGEQRRQIFQSEFALRAAVEETNSELRQLKRDFVEHASDIYIGFRFHPSIGYSRARDAKLYVASGNILMAEQFAEMLIKRHIIQRRLLTGLKFSLIRLLPMQTLVNLYERYDSFEWLRYQQQVDVRPKFPDATEEDFSVLYKLIGLRAQVRAAEDVLALTSDNIRRILQVAQWYLVDGKDNDKAARPDELRALASHTKQVLVYYLDDVVGWHERLHELYATYLEQAEPLAAQMSGGGGGGGGGGQEALVEFLDGLINNEALDIGLNDEARSLEYPPTMTEAMIHKLQKRWIPGYVLNSLQADRRLLITNRKRVMHLIKLEPARQDADLAKWATDVYTHICKHLAHTY